MRQGKSSTGFLQKGSTSHHAKIFSISLLYNFVVQFSSLPSICFLTLGSGSRCSFRHAFMCHFKLMEVVLDHPLLGVLEISNFRGLTAFFLNILSILSLGHLFSDNCVITWYPFWKEHWMILCKVFEVLCSLADVLHH